MSDHKHLAVVTKYQNITTVKQVIRCHEGLDLKTLSPQIKPQNFFRPCFFSEAKKVKERFKVVVVGGGSDRWASPASVCP